MAGMITLGTEEEIYRDIAFEALKSVFGEEEARNLIDEDDADVSGLIDEDET